MEEESNEDPSSDHPNPPPSMEDQEPIEDEEEAHSMVLTLTSSSSSSLADDDDLFEPVSLRDLNNADNPGSNPGPIDYPRGSKPPMPETAPEILHLVDSAIMGLADSVSRLQTLVSTATHDDVLLAVVDALLGTMRGGVGGFEEMGLDPAPSIMQNSRAALVAAELIPWLPPEGDSRKRMVRGLLAILQSCTRNRTMCSASGLLRVLLDSAEKVFVKNTGERVQWDCSHLCHCLQVLAGHSLSVGDLHHWVGMIKRNLMRDWAMPLTLALEKAVAGKEARGPAHSFEFDGERSGLLCPGDTRWPFSNGYGFATWIYMESFADTINMSPERNTIMPRLFSYLFSFLGSDGYGIEAYFHGHFLVVETSGGKGKKASIHFSYLFRPRVWYFVGLEHMHKQALLGKEESELRLYVDGNLHESRPFECPRVSKPLVYCCIGTNPPPKMAGLQRRRRQCPLFGEIGPVYIFKEPIGQERMVRLANRGGDALPSFGSGAGLPWMAVSDHLRNMAEESSKLDVEIGGSLYLLYHPILFNGRICPDASPSDVSGLHQRSAEALGQVHVAARIRPAESLWALAYGGPLALLPLTVGNIQMDNLEPMLADFPLSLSTASLSASIFRIISTSIQHPGNNEELCRVRAPELLSKILHYHLLTLSTLGLGKQNGLSDEELVAAIVSLCQSQKNNHKLKVQFFSTLLLDLRMWNMCNYSLQKKLLSSLADMVFTEFSVMRDANALQMLLDGCRQCYWVIHESDSVDGFSIHGSTRQLGEVNALVDELLVTVELLIVAAPPSMANEDVRCLISFLIDCPQPNQVARVLHLIYRLVVQPNTSRGHTFAQSFISCGGIETLLLLLQREAKTGNRNILDGSSLCDNIHDVLKENSRLETAVMFKKKEDQLESLEKKEDQFEVASIAESFNNDNCSLISSFTDIERMTSTSEAHLLKNLGGISFNINSENARNNVFNIDNGDGVVVGMINLLGALLTSGHLKFGSDVASQSPPSNIWSSLLHEEGSTMFGDKISLLLFSLQKAFQAAPERLMTTNVYMALLATAINVSSADEGLNIYDSGHRFEHMHLLLVLLRSLPYASTAFQARAIQDLLFLACSHPDNRSSLTCMVEWPEWLLEVLISNYEMGSSKDFSGVSIEEIEDLIHNFLIIMLEHSMRQKDGWKDVEATIHCAEWLSMIGGSSTGDQRVRREEALPIFKRRLLGGLLDFSSRELEVQTEVIAAAAAGVAAEGLSPEEAKAEAENATKLSVALAENAIVILMLVEDHLRLQAQLSCSSSKSADGHGSPASVASTTISQSNSLSRTGSESFDTFGSKRTSISSDTGGLSIDVFASMADANGQVSAAVMERLTAAAAAEPYESVRCAFVSYGTCVLDVAKGWKYRSRLWYGVGLPLKATFGGGGSGWEPWKSVLEKDSNGNWIELPLIKKSMAMLQSLLLDECAIGGGLNTGGGSVTGTGGMKVLYQLLDSDQPFLCMLRMVLASMREDDNGEDDVFMRNISIKDGISEGLSFKGALDNNSRCYSMRKPRSALLWSVLAPILNMPVSESKRQRVLVASSILYSEVWHAFGMDGKPLRKKYVENILPPFVAVLRRWRPLLAGIPELTSPHGENPLTVDDHALAADSLPLEAALSMVSPGWAAAFASPPAAMALAMIAAGTSGGETVTPPRTTQLRRDTSLLERRTTRLHTFASFQKPLETSSKTPPVPKDKAAAKAAALAAARDLERNAKIGSGRGLSAVAMATSAQRRSITDGDRAKRWSTSEAMGAAWTECLQSFDSKSVSGSLSSRLCYQYMGVLVPSFALARNMQRVEMDRRTQVDAINRYRMSIGTRAWRKLLHCLIEMSGLFGPLADRLCNPENYFWKLDFTISSSRMRRYLKKKYRGSDYLDAAVDSTEELQLHEKDLETPLTPCSISIAMVEDEDDEKLSTNNTDPNMLDQQRFSTSCETLESQHSGASSDQNLVHSTLGVAPGFVLIDDDDERIVLELPSFMVRPLKVVHGNFQITTKRINFIVDENISDSTVAAAHRNGRDKNRSWLISSIHQMFRRRYLLRGSAIEFFMLDRSAFFFDFGNIEGRKNAYRAILHARPPYLSNIYWETQRPEQLFKRTQLMERWARWEISNFEYLMELNILAGRSYNDITQYPVFPWILADYCSKILNLEDSSSYRDLSKPIGALNADRLKKFQERYSSFEDSAIPQFHYRSHYSSVGTALYYLVRVEPFTTLSIQRQGTKFDHANHIFSDINSTWNGVLEDLSDVKELVPEMFYLPEILTNEHLGTTQLRRKLGSVKLPPWANNPVDFIHKHRMALESEHVSTHLHEWIDLIFGYKQRGEESVSANNVFFYITYEGAVDIDKIADPVQRRAIQDLTVYCGQTPSQLLTVPHLKRKPLADVLHLQTIFRNPNEIKPYAVPSPECLNVPAASVAATNDSIIIVDVNAPSGNVAMHKWHPNTPGEQGNPFQFHHLKSSAGSSAGGLLRMLKGPGSTSEDWHFSQASAYAVSGIRSPAVVAITSDKEVITGGHADNSIKMISAAGAKTVETAAAHCAPVTCLSLSPDGNYLASGSRDTTVILWRIRNFPSQLNNILETSSNTPKTPTSPISGSNRFSTSLESSRRRRIEGPMHVLRGHLKEVVCCCVSSDLGIIASSSNTSGILLHSLRRGRLIRKLDVGEINAICLSSRGVVLLWDELNKKISTFTVNGTLISTNILSNFLGSISCIEISVDGENAVVGTCSSRDDITERGAAGSSSEEVGSTLSYESSENRSVLSAPSVCFLNLHTLEVFHTLDLGKGQDVTALALNKDNTNLLVSTADRQLIVFTNPVLSSKIEDEMHRQEGNSGK